MKTVTSAILLLAISFLTVGVAQGGSLGKRFTEIVTFGESSTDMGNVSEAQCDKKTGYPAAGFPLFWAPCTPFDPNTGSSGYFDGRLTNGHMWVEFLADALNVKRLRPSVTGGTNYAHAGAKTGPDWTSELTGDDEFNLRVNLYPGNPVCNGPDCSSPAYYYQAGELVIGSEVPHINTQIQQYLWNRGGFTGKQIVLIWGGANDLRDAGFHPSDDPNDPFDPEAGIANVVTNLATAVGTVAATGAEHIVVLNTLNIARAPITRASCGETPSQDPDPTCLAQIEGAVNGFNFALKDVLEGMQAQGVQVHYVDVFRTGETVVELSELFGKPFSNTNTPALLPNPLNAPYALDIPEGAEDYLFWDVIHPTEKLQRIIAYQVCKTLDRRIPDFEPECFEILQNH